MHLSNLEIRLIKGKIVITLIYIPSDLIGFRVFSSMFILKKFLPSNFLIPLSSSNWRNTWPDIKSNLFPRIINAIKGRGYSERFDSSFT